MAPSDNKIPHETLVETADKGLAELGQIRADDKAVIGVVEALTVHGGGFVGTGGNALRTMFSDTWQQWRSGNSEAMLNVIEAKLQNLKTVSDADKQVQAEHASTVASLELPTFKA